MKPTERFKCFKKLCWADYNQDVFLWGLVTYDHFPINWIRGWYKNISGAASQLQGQVVCPHLQ